MRSQEVLNDNLAGPKENRHSAKIRIGDVREWEYTGNKLHPTQKPVNALLALSKAFSGPGEVVLDPFCRSGSALIAAKILGRPHIGIELDGKYHAAALQQLRHHRLT